MDKSKFEDIFQPLADYFHARLDKTVWDIYYKRLELVPLDLLEKAVEILIDDSEKRSFPLLPEVWNAIHEVQRRNQGGTEKEHEEETFCQACENRGFILIQNTAHLCDCKHGRNKRIALSIPEEVSQKKRTEIQKMLSRTLPPASPPIQGLMEKNKFGFWEPNQTEHDKWMARKRGEIEEIDRRRANARVLLPALGEGGFAAAVQDTLAKVSEFGPMREPGEDEEIEEEF